MLVGSCLKFSRMGSKCVAGVLRCFWVMQFVFDGFCGGCVDVAVFGCVVSLVCKEEGKSVGNWYCVGVLAWEDIRSQASLHPFQRRSMTLFADS